MLADIQRYSVKYPEVGCQVIANFASTSAITFSYLIQKKKKKLETSRSRPNSSEQRDQASYQECQIFDVQRAKKRLSKEKHVRNRVRVD